MVEKQLLEALEAFCVARGKHLGTDAQDDVMIPIAGGGMHTVPVILLQTAAAQAMMERK